MVQSALKVSDEKRRFSRRGFFKLAGGGVGATAGALGYMHFAEAEWLEVNEHKVLLSPAQDFREVRVLHLSDFHASSCVSLDYIDRAITLALTQKPDLVCLTGDFITSKYSQFERYKKILARLSEAAPTVACMGNHDGGLWVRRWGYPDWKHVADLLNGAGVTLLHNESRQLELKGRPLQLVGVGDLWASELDPTRAFSRAEKLPTIVLSHNPDSKQVLGQFPWQLMLSGHTHGGQLWIPFLGAPLAPVRDKRYVAGLLPWGNRWIHVTKGVGNLHGMRFNCRPEVSLLRVFV